MIGSENRSKYRERAILRTKLSQSHDSTKSSPLSSYPKTYSETRDIKENKK